MKRRWRLQTAVFAAVVVCGAGLGAQSSSTDKSQSSQSTMTLTGCLQSAAGERGPVGTSGADSSRSANGAQSGAGQFILANARVGAAPGGGSGVTSIAPPGSGTNESAARAGSTQPSAALSGAVDKNGEPDKSATSMYALRSDLTEMPRHVGQEVEVSGNLVTSGTASRSASGSSSTTGSSTSSTTGSSTSSTNSAASSSPGATISTAGMQQFEVKTIRMIASVCAAR